MTNRLRDRDAGAVDHLVAQTEVTALLAGAVSLDEVAPEVLRIIAERLGWRAATLWTPSSRDGGFTAHASYGSTGERAGSTEPPASSRPTEPVWARERTSVPVTAGGELLGVLELLSAEGEPDEPMRGALSVLGRQLGEFIGRVEAQAELREAHARLERILESVGDAVLAVSPDGRVELANPRAEELLGVGAAEAVGRPVEETLELVDEESGRSIDAPPPVVAEQRRRVRYQNAILHGAETETFVDVTWSPMEDASGKLQGVVAALADVTDRRLEEKRVALRAHAVELLESSLDYESTLQRVAELAAEQLADWCAIFVTDGDGGVRRVATAYAGEEIGALLEKLYQDFPVDLSAPAGVGRVLRTGQSELHRNVSEEILAAQARSPEHLEALRRLGIVSSMEVALAARGRTLGAIIFASHDRDRRYGGDDLALAEELADRAALAIDNARQYVEAQNAIRARDDFVAIVSHELKSPLATLDFGLQALARFGDDAQAAKTAALTRRHIGRMRRLIDNLLDASRIQSDNLEIETEPCDLAELLETAAARLKESCERAGCELRLDLDRPVRGLWDPLRIDQIVTNLVTNAVKFGKGKPIDLSLRDLGGRARIAVRDRGPGIDPAERERIFDRFERSSTVADARTGVGLGLWIVQRSVEAMGGEISVDGAPGAGAEFTVVVPIAAEREVTSPDRKTG